MFSQTPLDHARVDLHNVMIGFYETNLNKANAANQINKYLYFCNKYERDRE